jgi:hypothetical protein
MKKTTILLASLLIFLLANPETTGESQVNSLETVAESQKIELLAEEGPKYNRNKIHRQNSPKRKNRRAKRLQRRNGIGMAYPARIEWLLVDVQLPKPLLAYELRKEVIRG